MRLSLGIALALAAAIAWPGCAAAPAVNDRPIARDPVCVYNHDLGCIEVRVDESTPHAEYEGRTYYFCSEDCREEFLEDPARYLAGRPGAD